MFLMPFCPCTRNSTLLWRTDGRTDGQAHTLTETRERFKKPRRKSNPFIRINDNTNLKTFSMFICSGKSNLKCCSLYPRMEALSLRWHGMRTLSLLRGDCRFSLTASWVSRRPIAWDKVIVTATIYKFPWIITWEELFWNRGSAQRRLLDQITPNFAWIILGVIQFGVSGRIFRFCPLAHTMGGD